MPHQHAGVHTHWLSRWIFLGVLGAGFLLATGCGDGGPEVVPVHGKVTFAGKSPPGPGTVYFAPVAAAEGMPSRPGSADFQLDGMFRATAFREREGLVPGTYRVQVVCWKRPPDPTSDLRAENYVPDNYHPPDLTIEPGTDGPVEVKYDVPQSK
jgi:hypothetical protein